YRRLADSVHQQAIEIPYANQLHRHAESIRRSFARINRLRSQVGMIETTILLDSDLQLEYSSIQHNLFDMGLTLERYSKAVNESSDDVRILVAKSQQQQSLAEIARAKEPIDKLWGSADMMTEEGNSAFSELLTTLARRTNAHVDLISSEMETFSADVRGQYNAWIWFSLLCMGLALLLVALLWFSFISLVAKPFGLLLDGSRLVAAGQYGHRIDLGTSDELNELAEAMNRMSTRFRDVYNQQQITNANLDREVKQRTREVIQNEQLASVGFLAAGVAHEINNPLASIAWSAESLQAELEDLLVAGSPTVLPDDYRDVLQENFRRIQEEAYRCKGITERLLDFSRLGDVSRSSVNLCELVENVVSLVGKLGKYRCKTLRVHCDGEVLAHVNSHEIQQVVLNLITNALESVDSDGAVDVYVRDQGNSAYVGVVDNGCGMSQEVLDHLFQPFFTRRRDGTGTGLGLSITYRIVSQHHGSLTASSDGEGKGSRLELRLPVHAAVDDTPDNHQPALGSPYDTQQVA
ncbi:MAG: HAMP domain-containing histidine kinase, partial [Pirellulaceae bacterium]|nr:HAMP domain-containing histidine kinase [Pirellulaceae bacterium]